MLLRRDIRGTNAANCPVIFDIVRRKDFHLGLEPSWTGSVEMSKGLSSQEALS